MEFFLIILFVVMGFILLLAIDLDRDKARLKEYEEKFKESERERFEREGRLYRERLYREDRWYRERWYRERVLPYLHEIIIDVDKELAERMDETKKR